MSNLTLLHLPAEVLEEIFIKLNKSDLRSLMNTCKILSDLIMKNNKIWKTVCSGKMLIHNSSHNKKPIPFTSYDQYRISNYWLKGISKIKLILRHNTNYMPWLMYYNSEALLVSVGSELLCLPADRRGHPIYRNKLWKLDVPTIRRNDIRTNDISRFVFKSNIMVCGNRDGCAAVFKVDNIRQKPHLLYHIEDCHEGGEVEVSAVELIPGSEKACAITGSIYSPNLCLWHFNVNGYYSPHENKVSGIHCIKISEDVGIRCMSLNNNNKENIALGLNGNSKPLLLDINVSKLLITADSTMDPRQTIRDIDWHDPNTIVLVTHSGKMQLIDVRTNEVVYNARDPFQSTFYCVKTDNDRALMVGTSEYSRCVLFDVRNQEDHTQMYFTQKKHSPIYSLDFDSSKLIAAADRSIGLLDFNIHPLYSMRRDYSHKFELVNR